MSERRFPASGFVFLAVTILPFGCGGTHRVASTDGGQGGQGGNGGSGNGGGGGGGGGGSSGGAGSGGRAGCGAGTTFGGAGSPWKNPVVQCQWAPPDRLVITTPVVIDVDKDGKPEIVFISGQRYPPGSMTDNFWFNDQKLHAIRGSDCSEVWTVATKIVGSADIAAGDLDGDGRPEFVGFYKAPMMGPEHDLIVVVHGPDGKIVAQSEPSNHPAVSTIDFATAAALADLDGDGRPEIVIGAMAYRFEPGPPATVKLMWAQKVPRASYGFASIVADVDLDGKPDVVNGTRIFDGVTGADKTPAGLAANAYGGFAAVAQFDRTTPQPELAIMSLNQVSIVDVLTGAPMFGPFGTMATLSGGPPTIADFDGDGAPEVGVAQKHEYRVYDPECAAVPPPSKCAAPGLLWTSTTQDGSGVTGSTVFDFNNDCAAEVVYRDECWLRIYDGATGEVRAAYSVTSGTALEEPVVADVDGDGHAEIVVSSDDTGYGSGVGRCPALPEAHNGAPWTGPTHGVYVLRDPDRRWAPARRIWNQNTYHVTNIDEDGKVPAKEKNSWDGYNNYRQNVKP